MKKTILYPMILLSISFLTSCASPAQRTDPPVQHADPFYNINDNDYPLLHLPLINPVEAKLDDGRSPWRVFLPYGSWVSLPNSQDVYFYAIEGYLLNNLGMATHRPEGLSGSTMFFKETFGTFPLLFEMIRVPLISTDFLFQST